LPQATLIQICDLTRRDARTNRLILDRVNLSILGDERIGLVGSSGSGKSSLLRAIAKLDRCLSGDVRFHGEIICKDAIPTYRRKVVYLPQRPSLVTGTVQENLELPFRFDSANEGYSPSNTSRWLGDLAKSDELLNQPVSQLSGGEQQIVALIRAISISPEVLLFDEPTASLDPETTQRFEELVLAWQQETESRSYRGFIWTSHDAVQIERMTNRRIGISDGVLAEEDACG
jgi:putative ABC transport system ATP-binding protein